ncbi:winged helix-turn-helix domain-containing protein [Streptomyces spirodelae]|uniref:Winged helix-turn-helix transcriptional regulator n=1 Tax=Streptomyces spirodelae TaxID=2812904 RepID=A0ABS3WW96_9ACTN|nr:winged helix-turn-helix domain-containing protein [Streptomyces spirodelae]MBO8187382.1 winged helix-turn-helix transcriptional regulator [Streptomyces spirodelae]
MAQYEWQRIARVLEEEIRSGHVPPGGALSSITRLAETYGVADRTIRRALRDLRERGLIETLPHKGSYVVDVLPPADVPEKDEGTD